MTQENLLDYENTNPADEAMIFVLAGFMADMYRAMLMKDSRMITNIIIKMGDCLKQDPTFMARFQTLRVEVMQKFAEKQAQASGVPSP